MFIASSQDHRFLVLLVSSQQSKTYIENSGMGSKGVGEGAHETTELIYKGKIKMSMLEFALNIAAL